MSCHLSKIYIQRGSTFISVGKRWRKRKLSWGAVVAPALLATMGFPEQWNRDLLASSPESPGGELSPQWWPLECRYGQCVLKLLINLGSEAVLGWSSPRDDGSRIEMGFCGTWIPWCGSRFFPNPSQIYRRDWLRELQPVARKQLTQGNYFLTGVMFPKSSCSFGLGTG